MKLSSLLILILLGSTFALAQPAKEYTFETRGKVVDLEGEPYAAMFLNFEKEGLKTFGFTDENGVFAINLPAGNYRVTASEATSKSFVAFVTITENGPNPTGYVFTIDLDKNWCANCAPGKMPEVIKHVVPPYPPTARAVGAVGEVVVSIKIAKDGKVISAQTISGHPLLKSVSAQAARGWVFSPDETIQEREGKLVFAFVAGKEDRVEYRIPNRLEISETAPVLHTTTTH